MLDWILLIFLLQKFQIRDNKLRDIAINHSLDIKTEDFINIYKECTVEPYLFFINDTTLASNNPLKFRKNLFNIYNKNHDN